MNTLDRSKKKILVLGANGMLGHMVKKYLEYDYIVNTVEHKWPSEEFKQAISNSDDDILINCIGAIPQKTKEFKINYELPIWLENNFGSNIIHPGTDCEMDNDDYGISKKRARDFIIDNQNKTKILKSSIIGPELNSKASLLEWFLSSENKVSGYTKAMWNGVTTLEWAKQCKLLIEHWHSYKVETILYSECISKYDLLSSIKSIFNKDIKISKNNSYEADKCLTGDISTPSIKIQLFELLNFYYDN